MHRLPLYLFLLLCCLTTGCASIVSKSIYPIRIESSPQEANITIVNQDDEIVFAGQTPASVELDADGGYFRPAKYLLTFDKEGYEELTIPLSAKIDGWYFGNFLFGGLIGFLIVDPLTGDMWKFRDESIMMSLREQGYGQDANSSNVHFVDYHSLTDEERKNLVKLR